VFLNQITTSHRDRYTKTPEYKITAVRIEKLEPVAVWGTGHRTAKSSVI
jgi:predicted molibdopterin-dependent oxidoreductase YjgC